MEEIIDDQKRRLIDEIQSVVKERKQLEGKNFEPYPESFKNALMEESLATLKIGPEGCQEVA